MGTMNRKIRESAFNADLKNTASMDVFNTFMEKANEGYTIVIADSTTKINSVLKDYIDSGVDVIWYNAYVTIIPLLTKQDAEDIAEDLTKNGLDFCVFNQVFQIA